MKKQHLIRNYEDILERFFQETRRIIYLNIPQDKKMRMLHGAHYRAKYYQDINNRLLDEKFRSSDQK